MSNDTNTQLLELASEHISYWEGEGIGAAIEQAVAESDLEHLNELVKESARLIYDFEMQQDDPMTDERAEAMYTEAPDVY